MKSKSLLLLLSLILTSLGAETKLVQTHFEFPFVDEDFVEKNGDKQDITLPTIDGNILKYKCRFSKKGKRSQLEIVYLNEEYFKNQTEEKITKSVFLQSTEGMVIEYCIDYRRREGGEYQMTMFNISLDKPVPEGRYSYTILTENGKKTVLNLRFKEIAKPESSTSPLLLDPELIERNLSNEKFISLTKLKPTKSKVGYGKLSVNAISSDNKPSVNGKECDEFIFAHATSHIQYSIPKGTRFFSATGISVGYKSVSFVVKFDGKKEVYTSGSIDKLPKNEAVIRVEVPKGAKTIDLIVDEVDDITADHSIWCYPRFSGDF